MSKYNYCWLWNALHCDIYWWFSHVFWYMHLIICSLWYSLWLRGIIYNLIFLVVVWFDAPLCYMIWCFPWSLCAYVILFTIIWWSSLLLCVMMHLPWCSLLLCDMMYLSHDAPFCCVIWCFPWFFLLLCDMVYSIILPVAVWYVIPWRILLLCDMMHLSHGAFCFYVMWCIPWCSLLLCDMMFPMMFPVAMWFVAYIPWSSLWLYRVSNYVPCCCVLWCIL